MKVVVVGAGKMGLPLACQLASRGAEVVNCDINVALVETINTGRMPFNEPGVEQLLSTSIASGALRASTDLGASLADASVVIILIPVLLKVHTEASGEVAGRVAGRVADLAAFEAVTGIIAAHLKGGMMISYETTLPVGTTRNVLAPILERSGHRAGVNFDLVFSPERVKSGKVLDHLSKVPKIVGGVTPHSAERAEEFYARYLGAPVINVGSLESAEFAKLAGMVYRDVNIALANELAAYAEAAGVDLAPAVAAANTDGESALLTPGIGVGGHCTPVYPYFVLQHAATMNLGMALTAESRRTNDAQPGRFLDRLTQSGVELRNSRLLILGLGFRPGVKEHATSMAFVIREEARRRGAEVLLHDPLYSHNEIEAHGFTALGLEAESMPPIVVLNTGHGVYAQVDFADWHRRGVQSIVDGRNFWPQQTVRAAGILYIAPGLS